MVDLRIGTVVLDAYRRVAIDWKNIGIFTLIGAAVLTALDAAQTHLLQSGQGTSLIWQLVVDTMIAFYLHRLVLLDSPGASWSGLKAMKLQMDGVKALFGKFFFLFGGFYFVLLVFLVD